MTAKNAEKGYNLTDGGQGSFGVFVSEDTKKRIRESLLKKTKITMIEILHKIQFL